MIQVVCFDISQADRTAYGRLYERASEERRLRADRYPRHEDALRCVAADALLQYGVKKALGISEFETARDAHGKPYLKTEADFHYNLSHSGNWVVIAYGSSEVGIDVEQIRMDTGKAHVARRFFTEDEQDFVFRTEEGSGERFFRIWTGKESYLKYLGTGLRRALDSFSVLDLSGLVLHSWELEGGYCVTLCSMEGEHTLELLTLEQLLGE